jgi:hypothetical protein
MIQITAKSFVHFTPMEVRMALITRLTRLTKARQSIHDEVEGAVSVLNAGDEWKYIQIDTFGSPERAKAGEVNQSIQLNRASAAELLTLILEIYPDLVH